MTDTNMAAIRAAAQALVHQAELAGVVVTIETVPKVPLAMGSYEMQVGVRAGRGPRPHSSPCGAGGLSDQDAELLEQGATMLEALAGDERNRGNDSAAMGAECSAHAVRRLAVTLMAAPTDSGGARGVLSKAVTHVLRQMQNDPRLAWLIGPGSRTYELLTEEAAAAGEEIEAFRAKHEATLDFKPWPSQESGDA